jgi:hypothetical protein
MGQLLTNALTIKNETAAGANTASRVGGWMEDCAESVERLDSMLNFFDFESESPTTANQNVWTPLVMQATEGLQRNGISVNGQGLVTYNGSAEKYFQFAVIASVIGTAQRKYHIAMYKNDAIWPCSEFAVSVGVQATEVAIPSQCVVPLEDGDTMQVHIKCSNGSLNVTLDTVNVIIRGI